MGEGGEKWESGEAVSGEVQVSEETIVAQQSSRLIGEEDGGRMHSLEKEPTNVPKLTNMALCRAATNVDLLFKVSFKRASKPRFCIQCLNYTHTWWNFLHCIKYVRLVSDYHLELMVELTKMSLLAAY